MTPQPNPAGRTRRNVDELRQLARDCGWRISSSIGYIDTWRLIGSPDETLSIPTSREADRFDEWYDAALARLTPEPPAHAAAPAGAMEAIAEILREVNPRTWVEHTPSGLAYHLAQAAYPAMVAQAHADAAFIARNMCHWMQGVGDARKESHEQFHYGNVCPYEAVAAVLSGQPGTRDAAFTVEPASLAGVTGELAEHSAALDHALDHDGAGHWFCKTCAESVDANEPTLVLPDDVQDFFTYAGDMSSDDVLRRVRELSLRYGPASEDGLSVDPQMAAGPLVSTMLTGRIIHADPDRGCVYLQGEASGGHVPWVLRLHWATEFTTVGHYWQIDPTTATR